MIESEVEYWWNDAIEKYQFKFWFKPEKAWVGLASKTPQSGIEALEIRYPNIKFKLVER